MRGSIEVTRATAVVGLLALPAALAAPAAAGAPAPLVEGVRIEERHAAAGLAGEVSALAARRDGPVWIAWTVPAIPGEHRVCCYGSIPPEGRKPSGRGLCELERDRGFSLYTDDEDPTPRPPSRHVHVVARAGRGVVAQVRGFSEDCRLDPGGRPFHWLTGVTASESLAWLERFVRRGPPAGADGGGGEAQEDLEGEAMAVIALHQDPEADRILEAIASSGDDVERRGHALFWLGNLRGRRGYEVAGRIARQDEDPEVRRKAIFALSQSAEPEAIDALIALARRDRDHEVRGEALFWLAQAAGRVAAADEARRALTDAIESDPETEVKKKAVFALSHLPADEGVPLLIKVARTHGNGEVRREAIFWLGQSRDPRALEFIEAILRS